MAEIFSRHADQYLRSHRTNQFQRQAIKAIVQCRTSALGGHAETCRSCRKTTVSYNSCRNRHCPKCQGLAQFRWIRQREARILPTRYFHVVFTVPQQLRKLFRANPELMHSLLFSSTSKTLLDAAKTKFDCQLAVTSVLHTWTRDLRYHPHIHCIVSAGGLSSDAAKWVPSSAQYLLPVKLMSRLFRGKFLDGLTKLVAAGKLDMSAEQVVQLKRGLYSAEWVVYAKKPFQGPSAIFRYLGQYTHRVGITNHRIRSITEDRVVFSTKDGKVTCLEAVEFIRRFLCHVLPRGFVKIRHYGLAASANLNTRMVQAQSILATTTPEVAKPDPSHFSQTWKQLLQEMTGIDVELCESCRAQAVETVAAKVRRLDTS